MLGQLLKEVASGEKSPTTLELYRRRYSKHLEPRLGRRKLQDVKPGHLATMLQELRAEGLAPWSVKAIYGTAGNVLRFALGRGYISANPCARISDEERPKGRNITKGS